MIKKKSLDTVGNYKTKRKMFGLVCSSSIRDSQYTNGTPTLSLIEITTSKRVDFNPYLHYTIMILDVILGGSLISLVSLFIEIKLFIMWFISFNNTILA